MYRSVQDRNEQNTSCGMCAGRMLAGSRHIFLIKLLLLMFSPVHHLHCSRFQRSIHSIKFFSNFFLIVNIRSKLSIELTVF